MSTSSRVCNACVSLSCFFLFFANPSLGRMQVHKMLLCPARARPGKQKRVFTATPVGRGRQEVTSAHACLCTRHQDQVRRGCPSRGIAQGLTSKGPFGGRGRLPPQAGQERQHVCSPTCANSPCLLKSLFYFILFYWSSFLSSFHRCTPKKSSPLRFVLSQIGPTTTKTCTVLLGPKLEK